MSTYLDPLVDANGKVTVDFLLPTGILVMFECKGGQTISEIKGKLWEAAKNYPLYNQLRQAGWYVLMFVNRKAEQEECLDEQQRLCDLQMYKPLFKLVERKGNEDEKKLSTQISWLIGRQVKEFENSMDNELTDFRILMVEECRKAIENRSSMTWQERLVYCYPPSLDSSPECSNVLADKLTDNNQYRVSVDFCSIGKLGQSTTILIGLQETPIEVVEKALKKIHRTEGEPELSQNPHDYILKVCGIEEYIIGEQPMIQFKFVRRPVCKGTPPKLTLVLKSAIYIDLEREMFIPATVPRQEVSKAPKSSISLWDIKGKFSIKVTQAYNLNVSKETQIQVHAGLFHGTETLCKAENTRSVQLEMVDNKPLWHWNENIEFSICVSDLPQGARLCLAIYAVFRKKKKEEKVPLAWVNQALFDYRFQLASGSHTLPCWTVSPEDPLEERLNPIGTVVTNSSASDAPTIMLNFKEYASSTIMYPPLEKVLEVASQEMDKYKEEKVAKAYEQELKEIVEKDPLAPMFEQDKELVWRFRMYLLENLPESLPKLLGSVKWSQHKDVAVLQSILQAWRPLPPEDALELLDYDYQDMYVRAYAVRCIDQLPDSELAQYLLQLCQALKYESHLDNALARFLLERAWKNKCIGHYLFWHLRAEMDVPEASQRFGLLLEAYLRGSVNHIPELRKQMDGMGKMRSISELLHSKAFRDRDKREKAKEAMLALLAQGGYQSVLGQAIATLNPKIRLGKIKDRDCKFYDSKMRPLLMVYENPDPSAQPSEIKVIFKNGDDLRQDMLTLQIIRVMDNIWQQEGLDMRLLPYNCISTGTRVGFIECVTPAETIANIQKTLKTKSKLTLWDSSLLYQWLKEKSSTDSNLQKAAEMFCWSCAGYCVATYVLGIGDRHSDNIMVKTNGQLFHIDFGHFLGNFKVKFGVRRERVPFVLASDFEHIIEKHYGFNAFASLCEQAYLILRRRAPLLINLLAMMLQTGIPELRSMDDLNYVREALVLGESESMAKDHFRAKLQEARRNAWSTSLNWYVHGLAKDNRQ